jgi:hypothetical protein
MSLLQLPEPSLDEYIRAGADTSAEENKNNVSMVLDGRRYGQKNSPTQLFEQPLPPGFQPIAQEMWNKSALLKLTETADKKQIFTAYKADLQLLQKYLNDFEHMVQAAIRQSIVCSKGNELNAEKQWEQFRDQLPVMGKDPLLKLSSDRAAQAPHQLQLELREEIEQGVIRVVTRMAFWLQLLVDNEFVGLVTWTAPDVCNYHYFFREKEQKTVDVKENTVRQRSDSNVPGQLMQATQTVDITLQRRDLRERHTHHIVNVSKSSIADSVEHVPHRVAAFLADVPDWLIPHLHIVTGEMTMEEIHQKELGNETVTHRTTSTWKYDPAITFGRFAMIGYTGEEVTQDNGGVHVGQQKVATHAYWRNLAYTGVMLLVVLSITAWGITAIVRSVIRSNAEARAAYAGYVASLGKEKPISTRKGEVLTLPGISRQIRFAGIGQNNPGKVWINMVEGDTIERRFDPNAPPWYSLEVARPLPDERGGIYGDADLAQDLHVLAKLRVVRATDDRIEYVVKVYQK